MSITALLAHAAFDSETTKLLASAFDAAWIQLKDSGSPLASEANTAATREALAERTIEMGQRGGRDLRALVNDSLSYVGKVDG
jgi:hypothetical protein